MNRLGPILGAAVLLGASLVHGQTTVVSATVVDSDSTTWTNGNWTLQFVPNPSNPNIGAYTIDGTPLAGTVLNQSGSLDGSGTMSVSMYQTAPITPVGSQWQITVCPNATTACGVYRFTAVGSTMDISSALTGIIPAPRFKPVSGAYGYNDTEAVIQLLPGSTYWNVTTPGQRCYTGSGWGNCGGAGNVNCSPLTAGSYLIATDVVACADGGIYDDGSILNVTTLSDTGTPAIQISTESNDSPYYHAGVIITTSGSGNATMEAGTADSTSEKFILDSVHGTRLVSQNGLTIAQDGGGGAGGLALQPGVHVPIPWTDGGTYVQLVAPVSIDTSYNLILPASQGTGALTNDGSGNLSWIAGSSGITQLTGDVTAGPGSGSQAATLPTVNSSPGSCGDASHVCQVTTNGKGLVTGQTAVPINTTPLSTQTNCLTTTCAGGSTYVSGSTYTNSSSHLVQEEVTMTAFRSSGATGGDSQLSTVINGTGGPGNGVWNQCNGVASVSFLVPPGGTFSATSTLIDGCTTGTATITAWLEVTLP